jgi:NTE family protein
MERLRQKSGPVSQTKTAFVFAGGGSLGAVQVGMLRELLRAGVEADIVIGSSVGALNAAFFAGRPTLEGVDELAAIWRTLRRRDIFPVTFWGALRWFSADGLFDPSGLRRLIERNLPFERLEDAELPLHVVATDLGGGAVRLSSGPAAEAILASAAIPVVFPSVELDSRPLMDGAVSGNTPIVAALELGARRLIVLPTGFSCALAEPPKGAVARGFHALTLLIAHQMLRDLAQVPADIEVSTVPSLCPLSVSPFDFSQTDALIERAASQTRAWLADDGLSRRTVPEALFAHTH